MGRAGRRVVIVVAAGVLAAGLGGMAATGAAAAVPGSRTVVYLSAVLAGC